MPPHEPTDAVVLDAPETCWKPLGRGYSHYDEYFLQYCPKPLPPDRNPELAANLNALTVREALDLMSGLPPRPCCLIEGITCPRNGTALRQYLQQAGIADPEVHAIDIMDVQAVASAAGCELVDLEFSVGDAAQLDRWADGSADLLVQDHLLNCAPHAIHQWILREARRALSPEGLLILNFSADPDTGTENTIDLRRAEQCLGTAWNPNAYCLNDLVPEERREEMADQLCGKLVTGDDGLRQVLVTQPYGNFEFYFPVETLERSLDEFGLEFAFLTGSDAPQQGGGSCRRYRALVRPARKGMS
jgi:Methyltransferase domain